MLYKNLNRCAKILFTEDLIRQEEITMIKDSRKREMYEENNTGRTTGRKERMKDGKEREGRKKPKGGNNKEQTKHRKGFDKLGRADV